MSCYAKKGNAPSYQLPNQGPWGQTIENQLATNAHMNVAFSQEAWNNAQLDGCLSAPCFNISPQLSNLYPQSGDVQPVNPNLPSGLPSYPPPAGKGFVYPMLDSRQQTFMDAGVRNACPQVYALQSPFNPLNTGMGQYDFKSAIRQELDLVNPSQNVPNVRFY